MAFKSYSFLFVSTMVVAMVAAPMAEAQLGLVGELLGLININGIVRCSLNGSTTAPAFSNALVQLQCGSGNVVSTATTNGSGAFSMVLNPVQFLLSTLLSGCSVVVKTPLSTCDATLPGVGGLISSLEQIGSTLLGLLNITNLIPRGFNFLPSL